MTPQIRLSVSNEVEAAQHYSSLHRCFEYAGCYGLVLMHDLLLYRQIDRKEFHRGELVGRWGRHLQRFEIVEYR